MKIRILVVADYLKGISHQCDTNVTVLVASKGRGGRIHPRLANGEDFSSK